MESTEPDPTSTVEASLSAPSSPSPPPPDARAHVEPPQPAPVETSWPPATKWIIGVLAVATVGLTSILSIGLAAIVWVPLLLGFGVVLLMVWSARRQRQRMQNRGPDEVRDPTHAESPWPTEGVIDDRLPER
jgi:hypothetical protein